MNKQEEIQFRNKIRKQLISEAAFAGSYTKIPNIDEKKLEPSDVEVNDNTIGVMEYKYDSKSMENIDYVLEKLEPYFDDIDVKYIGISDDTDSISVNIKHRYKDLLDALMTHYGFTKDVETWGNEMRSGKRVYSARTSSTFSGTHGNYPMPILLGEYPSSTFQ